MSKIEGLYAREYDLVVNSRIVPSGMDIKTSEGVESFSVCVCVCLHMCVYVYACVCVCVCFKPITWRVQLDAIPPLQIWVHPLGTAKYQTQTSRAAQQKT